MWKKLGDAKLFLSSIFVSTFLFNLISTTSMLTSMGFWKMHVFQKYLLTINESNFNRKLEYLEPTYIFIYLSKFLFTKL